MAKKKKEVPIIGLGNEDKLIVQKSIPLFSLWKSPLTLSEFKILDVYLSRINSHDPDKRTVSFQKGELEQILGVERIRVEDLDERLLHLGTPIKVDDTTAPNKKFARICLFEKSVAEQATDGTWQVELTASQSAMKYFFHVENLHYLRYKLRCIISLSSRYTYIMFIYLERYRFRGTWSISLDELKKILACDNEPFYNDFRRFNEKILKRVQAEMLEKTECRYTYTPIKKGRTVISISFTVEPLIFKIESPEASSSEVKSWEEKLEDFNFTQERINELKTLLEVVPKSKLSLDHDDVKARNLYMLQKISTLERLEADKKAKGGRIRSRFYYLKNLIEKDIVSACPQSYAVTKGTQAFRNFTERDPAANAEKYRKQIYDQYKQQ